MRASLKFGSVRFSGLHLAPKQDNDRSTRFLPDACVTGYSGSRALLLSAMRTWQHHSVFVWLLLLEGNRMQAVDDFSRNWWYHNLSTWYIMYLRSKEAEPFSSIQCCHYHDPFHEPFARHVLPKPKLRVPKSLEVECLCADG